MSWLRKMFLRYAPYWTQDVAVSLLNNRLYRQRHRGTYKYWRDYYSRWSQASPVEISEEASQRLQDFLVYACAKSPWYAPYKGMALVDFPILEKSSLVCNLSRVATIAEKDSIVSLTGGTTGASMKVYYTPEDMQQRFALLDHFRAAHGYSLGERVAWFSGKHLATQVDVVKGRCYRDDLINKVRFFSTFHINDRNFSSYWRALEEFRPRFMVGFPSSIYEIAVMAKQRGLKASYEVQTVFPTAETVLPMHRDVIGSVFSTRLVDQYASSEGAPFILECHHGMLHIHPLSGVFEVVDDTGRPSCEGEMLVTSFTTHGTPLIRYRIGDRIKLSGARQVCACGSVFPMVDWIDGRTSDFIWSLENGRVNLGNLSNSTKDIVGIRCFQVIQNDPSRIEVHVVGSVEFDAEQERAFVAALRERVGGAMEINLSRVEDIPREKSGKFRIVKSSIASKVQG